MARTTDQFPMRRMPSLKGVITIYARHGQPMVRAWPRKQTQKEKKKTEFWRNRFALANKIAKYSETEQIVNAREYAKGSPYLPRDLLVREQYGRLFNYVEIDGTTHYSTQFKGDVSLMLDLLHTRSNPKPASDEITGFNPFNPASYHMANGPEVSGLLDVIETTKGSLLVRDEDMWRGLKPGTEGQVLTVPAGGLPPAWSSPAGLNPRYYTWAGSLNGTASATAGAMKGMRFTPAIALTALHVQFAMTTITGATYRCELWRMNGPNLDALVAQTPDWGGTANVVVVKRHSFVTPHLMTANIRYGLFMRRIDGAAATVLGLHTFNGGYGAFPFEGIPNERMELSTLTPAQGMVTNPVATAAPYCIFLEAN